MTSIIDTPSLPPGHLRFVQLEGLIGAGKSALLSHVIARLGELERARPAEGIQRRIFLAQGDRLGTDAPLVAFRMMIEQLLHDSLERALDTATPSVLAARCVDAVGETPLLVAVDDAQWLDTASETFLTALMQAPFVGPLVVLVVHRTGHEPSQLLAAALGRGALCEHVFLPALADDAIGAIADGLGPQQIESVVEAAQGNPLFAHTAAAAFRRHPHAATVDEVLTFAGGSHSAVLSAAVESDLDSLGDTALRTLETLAVIGEDDVEKVSDVAELAPAQVRSGMRELAERGLLSDSPHEVLHPVVRFSAYRRAGAERRARMHMRAAYLPDADLFGSADHIARTAADLRELPQGTVVLGAGDVEVLISASEVAIGSDPGAVLEWLRVVPEHLHTPRSEILFARALLLAGDFDTAIARLRELLEHDGSVEVRALLANALRLTGNSSEARTLLATDQSTVDPELLREYIDILALIDGQTPDELLSRLESFSGDANRAVAAIYRTMSLLSEGRVPQARVTFQRAVEWLAEATDLEIVEVIHAVTCAAWASYMLDSFELGAAIAERALRLARRHARADVFSNLGTALLFCRASLGRLAEADAAGEQAICDAERYGTPDTISMARAGLMIAAQGRADNALLLARFEDLEATPVPEFGWWRRAVLTTRARVSALLGRPEPSLELLGKPRDAMAALRHCDAAIVANALGEHATATSLLAQALDIAEAQEAHGQHAMIQIAQAEIMLAGGEALQAGNLFREARDVVDRLGMRLQVARAHGGIARADAMLAERSDALTVLTTRERQVAELVAAGLKNREIAERLVLSPRTPEQHVRNILKKLGLGTREDIVLLVNG